MQNLSSRLFHLITKNLIFYRKKNFLEAKKQKFRTENKMMALNQVYFLAFVTLGSLLVLRASSKSIEPDQPYDFDPTFNQDMVPMDPTAPFLNAGQYLLCDFFVVVRVY
jgi:hypothetical protein